MNSKTAVLELKAAIRSLTEEAVIQLARGDLAFAVFPEAGKGCLIQANPYFAQDFPDHVGEQYWSSFGPWARVGVFVKDMRWRDIPADWLDTVDYVIGKSDEIEHHKNLIIEILTAGLAAKASELRKEMLSYDHAGAIEDALVEIANRN